MAFSDCYPLGLWQLAAENKKDLIALIGELGFVPEFGYSPSEDERKDAEKLGRGVLAELTRRAETTRANHPKVVPAALLILDNVSESGLLAATQLSKLPKVDWLRFIATTRLDPQSLDPGRKNLGSVEVDSLDPETP